MKRLHPVNILENMPGYFWLLLLPLLRGFLRFRGGLFEWLGGVWLDLLVLVLIALLAFLRWRLSGYRLMSQGVLIRKGLFLRRKLLLPYREFASFTFELPFYYRPFRVARLYVDSEAGSVKRHDFALTLSFSAARELFETLPQGEVRGKEVKCRAGNFYTVLLAFASSRSLAGVALFSAFAVQAGRVLGRELRTLFFEGLTDAAHALAAGIPPIAVFLVLVVSLGWGISFLVCLLRSTRFSLARNTDRLRIESGLFSRHVHLLTLKKTGYLEVRQSLLTRALKVGSLFLYCAGYGKRKNELEVLFPAAGKKRVEEILSGFVPEWSYAKREVFPSGTAVIGLVLAPFLLLGCALIPTFFGEYFLPFFSGTIRLLGVLFFFPLLWWMLARIIGFFHIGLSEKDGYLTLRYLSRFGFRTVLIGRDKVTRFVFRRSFWQRRSGCCTVIVYARAEGRRRFVIPALPYREAKGLFETVFNYRFEEEKI